MIPYAEALQGFVERSKSRRAQVQSIIDQRQVDSLSSNKTAKSSRNFNPTASTGTSGKGMSLHDVMAAIAKKESGGNYSSTGEVTASGDKAYGKYQIMGSNIPSWTQQYLGKSLTPEQFLSRRHAQDKVAKGKLQYYYNKYGAGGAAAAWYGGESVAQEWKKYQKKSISPAGTSYPSIFEYVKDILKG